MPYGSLRLIGCGLHLFLIVSVSCTDTFRLIRQGTTLLPKGGAWQKAEWLASAPAGLRFTIGHPLRQAIRAYLHGAGIESGYSYFAPNVPRSYKLLFEMQYADESVDYDVLESDASESNIRLSALLDSVGQTTSDPFRELVVKYLAHSIWQMHPQAVSIRAIVGALTLPTLSEYQSGKGKSYEFLYAYEFSREP